MLDIGFSELMVIGVVALVVIGPERMPKVARTAGILLGRMQRYVAGVKADISREMEEFEQLKDLKNLRSEIESAGSEIESGLRKNMADAQSEVNSISNAVGANMANGLGGLTRWARPISPPRLPTILRTKSRFRDRRRWNPRRSPLHNLSFSWIHLKRRR